MATKFESVQGMEAGIRKDWKGCYDLQHFHAFFI